MAAAAGTEDSSSLGALVLPAVGPGYAVLSQGPIDPATFASSAPDPAAVSSALSTLSGTVQQLPAHLDRHGPVERGAGHALPLSERRVGTDLPAVGAQLVALGQDRELGRAARASPAPTG